MNVTASQNGSMSPCCESLTKQSCIMESLRFMAFLARPLAQNLLKLVSPHLPAPWPVCAPPQAKKWLNL